MSDLVGNPEDRFSHNEAQMSLAMRKPNMRITNAQISCVSSHADQRLRMYYLDSRISLLLVLNPKFHACTALFVPDLVGNHADRFSRDAA